MADGTQKPIQDVKVGDYVIATDPETGERLAKPVLHVFVHEDTVTDLQVDGETITTTEDHPFWSVTDQKFERADQLALGEQVLTGLGEGTVTNAAGGRERRAITYNLEIQDIHTYHAGASAVLVHNARTCGVVRNQGLAGSKHPATGVPFDKDGFPDFSAWRHPEAPDVRINPSGSRGADFRLANEAAGLLETPSGYTWHPH